MASKPVPDDVHKFRTAVRRLEAVLEELFPEQSRHHRKMLRQLSRLRRRAGRVRDLDVQIARLRSLKMSAEPRRKTEILRTLAEMRGKRERKLLKALDGETVGGLRRRLKRAQADFETPPRTPDPLALSLRLFKRLADQQGPLTEEVLHQYRMNGKRVRYIAELAGKTGPAQHMIAKLEHMQDALGDWHDWLSLTQTVQKLAGDDLNSPLLSALNNITRAKLREAMQAVTETRAALLSKPVSFIRHEDAHLRSAAAARRKPSSSQAVPATAIA